MSLRTIIFTFLLSLLMPVSIMASEIITLPDYSFKYSAITTASKATIWRLWSDVEHWKDFDVRLEYSHLVGEKKFEVGAIGYLKGKHAPKTKFELIEVHEGVSFIESLKIPLYQTIELKRYFEKSEDGRVIFTHEVNFKGSLRALMYVLLSGPFKKDLKLVVERLKTVAESNELSHFKN